jgi:acid phosphatase class B
MLSQENMWLKLSAYNDNCQALHSYIEDHGADDICFVTSRQESAGASTVVQTQLWLDKEEIGQLGMPVFVTTDSKHKRQVLEGERIQFFLDDSPSNVRECKDLPNLRAFLLDRPNNQTDSDLPRVYSVAEFLLEVETASHAE